MRDEIFKYLGTVLNSTAKTIADRVGIDRTKVAMELNSMCREEVLCREKRGKEYVYWIKRENLEVAVEKVIDTLLTGPMLSVLDEKTEVARSEGQLDQECAKLRAQIVELEKLRDRQALELHDIKVTAKNRQEKIRELETRCNTQASTLTEREAAHESRIERLAEVIAERDRLMAEIQIVISAKHALEEEVKTLRSAEPTKTTAPLAHTLIEAFAATFGYEVVISHELGSIIKPVGKVLSDAEV